MPLSDHEQRIIQELEEQLAAADPRLARILSAKGMRRRSVHLARVGLAIMAVGIAAMIAALRMESIRLGVGAFLMMALGLYLSTLPAALGWWRHEARRVVNDAPLKPDS